MRFRAAARLYDELWRRGCRDPNLALNRGNARRLGGDLAGAILALNEGLVAARWNRPLQVALEDARSAVSYPAHSDLEALCRPAPASTIGTRMSPVEARLTTALVWFLACGGVTRFVMTRAGWWLAFAGLCIAGLLLLGGLWLRDAARRSQENEHPLIVVAQEVQLRKGNAEAFPPRFEDPAKLPKGVEGREIACRGGWVQIRLASGSIGWVPLVDVLKTDDR